MVISVGLALALGTGCARMLHRRQAQVPPEPGETLPEWAFDAPFYFRPPPDAAPQLANQPDADHPARYFVRDRVILLDRPANEVPLDRAPRIAVWWTNTDGCEWTRAGYFGLGQTHFPFVAGDDGDYGIRFVGPGIRASLSGETPPHRIYHLDTCPPCVTVSVEPDKPIYDPSETITIGWLAVDLNIDKKPAELAVCWSWENPGMLAAQQAAIAESKAAQPDKWATRLWQPISDMVKPEGSLTYTIPPYAAGEGFQIQVRAKDRAGNYGAGYSELILVNGFQSWPTTQPIGEPPTTTAPAPALASQPTSDSQSQ